MWDHAAIRAQLMRSKAKSPTDEFETVRVYGGVKYKWETKGDEVIHTTRPWKRE